MKVDNRICCVFNHPSHYRENIYLKMEKELDCDFYFGIDENSSIKMIDYNLFNRPVNDLKILKLIGPFFWLTGTISICFKPYKSYILNSSPFCVSSWVILFFNRLFGKKSYLWSHGWYGREGKMKSIIKKVFFKLSSGVFLYGNYAKELMIKEGFNKSKLQIIHNSLNYDEQLIIRKKLTPSKIYENYFNNSNPTLVFIGRLTKVKKLNLVFEALSILMKKGVNYNIILIGEGEEKKRLMDLSLNLKLKNTWFYGKCYDEAEIANLIFNSDICISPGNVGLTAIHCLMYGTPVITHNNFKNQMPEFESIIPNATGAFFIENNPHDLSVKIEEFLKLINENKEFITNNCYEMIDERYNPYIQINIMKSVLS
jgi:glycosyltransferase involved in cell wall biosynthesis